MGAKLATFLVAVGVSLVGTAVLLAVMVGNTVPGGREPTDVESLGVLFLCGFAVVLAWCAWRWLRQGHRRPGLAGSVGAIAVTIVAGGLAALALAFDGERPCGEVRADAGDFRDARRGTLSEDPPTEAQLIADDLIRCRVLRSMSRPAVVRMLGRPDGTSGTPRIDLSERGYEYLLGTERGYIAIDRGRVRSVAILPT